MRIARPVLFVNLLNISLTISSFLGVFSCAGGEASSLKSATTDGAPGIERQTPEMSFDKKEMLADKDTFDESPAPEANVSLKDGAGRDEGTTLESARKLSLRDDTRVRAPQLLARIDKPDSGPLPFTANDISVVIAGHRARVVFDMVFENPSERQLSGTLMIEIPQGASPCYLGMFQGSGSAAGQSALPAALLPAKPAKVDSLLKKEISLENVWQTDSGMVDWKDLRAARVVNPVQGREVYESVTRRKVDPALAEWAGGNKFSTRVFPIPAKSFKRVVFAYDRPLAFSGGKIVFPLPVPETVQAETRVFVHLLGDSGLTGSLIAQEKTLTPSSVPYGSFWKINPGKDFKGNIVFSGTTASQNVSVLAGSDSEVSGRLVHLLLDPGVTAGTEKSPTGRAVFLLDTSLSAKNKIFSRSGLLFRKILESDSSITEFAVVAFDVRARLYTGGFLANNPQNRASLLAALENVWLEGATNLTAALKLLAADPALAAADAYFLLSDGIITWGGENPENIKNGFSELVAKRWICYTFGDEAANRGLFSMLAKNSGQIVHVALGQDLAPATLAHRARPATLDSLFGANQEELVLAGDPRLLYPGQVLEIACRTRSGQDRLSIVYSINGTKRTVEIPLKENPLSSGLAARSWADLYANRLLDLYDKTADETALALSQHFLLSNRQASFIILETDAEYVEHKIVASALDVRELARLAREHKGRLPFGAPETDDLGADQLGLVESLRQTQLPAVWDTPKPLSADGDFTVLSRLPALKRSKETPAALYVWAQELKKSGRNTDPLVTEQALRALSSIVELSPQDDAALRLVGYVLLEWSLYREAEDLFLRVRTRRPFEPQNYLLEGMALAVQGKTGDAALRFEIVLTRAFPRFDDYVKPVATILYTDLLREVVATQKGSTAAGLAEQRLRSLQKITAPKGRLFLFWNLDDTDVDLHVTEPGGEEVYYEHPDSATGGQLFWDNTTGLGPELYEHPRLDQRGFDVFVNYFGSGSLEGAAPASTLVFAFTRRAQGKPSELRFYTTVLVGTKEDKVMIMPKWRP